MSSAEIEHIVSKLADAERELSALQFDRQPISVLGRPASELELRRLEKRYGSVLPESYADFLRQHNGWTDFAGAGSLLSTDSHELPWVKAELDIRDMVFSEARQINPLQQGGIAVALGTGRRNLVVLSKPSGEDPGKFSEYDLARKVGEFADFRDYLLKILSVMLLAIDIEKRGR